MRILNPAHMEAVTELVNKGFYYRLLDMDVEELGEGYSRVRVPVSQKHWNSFGGIHGGAMASILDTAAYWAAYATMDEGMGFTTLDLNVNCLRAVSSGFVVCEGRVKKQGRSIVLVESELRDEAGRLIATAQSKLFVSPSLQPMTAAIDVCDPGLVLPPKWIEA